MAKKGGNQGNNDASVALAAVRIMLGFVFLWAFLDKTFGLGYATTAAGAWVAGGSPTTGFLMGAGHSGGPFAEFFLGLAGLAWVDWLFMLGLLGIGAALLLGVALRATAVSGVVLLVLMWAASLPLTTNPVIDDHLVYAAVLVALAFSEPKWSVGSWWKSLKFVKKQTWLQ